MATRRRPAVTSRKRIPANLSLLPAVDRLLRALEPLPENTPRSVLVSAVRSELATRRAALRYGAELPSEAQLLEAIRARMDRALAPSLRPVINATGILVHTNLGRVPLAQDALEAVRQTCEGYNNLELDLDSGGRGSRQSHVEGLLRELSGAEAAMVVNNCAAAMLLALAALAQGREVVVSRGELVEIGGSFRMPDVMEAGGARLREVGTTNRTRLSDYAKAIGRDTAMLLRVHRSNFEVRGFTEEVEPAELVALGRKRKVPVVYDLGSGLLPGPDQFGLAPEPSVGHSVRTGFDLVIWSGDKLLGGPQAGMITGRKRWVSVLGKHPLARALRPGKMTLAALEATLRIHRDPGRRDRELPLFRMLTMPLEALRARALKVCQALSPVLPVGARLEARDDPAQVGGGTLPQRPLPSVVVALVAPGRLLTRLERALRAHRPPVVARIQDGALKMDLRTVSPEQDPQLVEALTEALRSL